MRHHGRTSLVGEKKKLDPGWGVKVGRSERQVDLIKLPDEFYKIVLMELAVHRTGIARRSGCSIAVISVHQRGVRNRPDDCRVGFSPGVFFKWSEGFARCPPHWRVFWIQQEHQTLFSPIRLLGVSQHDSCSGAIRWGRNKVCRTAQAPILWEALLPKAQHYPEAW